MGEGGGLRSVYFANTYGRPAVIERRLVNAYSASRYSDMSWLTPRGTRKPFVRRWPVLSIRWYVKLMSPSPRGSTHACALAAVTSITHNAAVMTQEKARRLMTSDVDQDLALASASISWLHRLPSDIQIHRRWLSPQSRIASARRP